MKKLIEEYINAMRCMARYRSTAPDMYVYFDKVRTKLHDEILKKKKTNRADKKFAFWLAKITEERLRYE